ncbi:MAG: hypothetical protein BGO41_11400 [Clostridiales bacterium 38-18]|nr:MAG: hypothetical protein BGO41_11400 [Clostridiales bacterium 38-18]
MIKISSILFVTFLVAMFAIGIVISFFPSAYFLANVINFMAIGLLIVGIMLIVALIWDRYKTSKSEGDDYKKY